MHKHIIFLFSAICLIVASAVTVSAQSSPDGIWNEFTQQSFEDYQTAKRGQAPWIAPDKFRLFTLDETNLERILIQAPLERLDLPLRFRPMPAQINLPTPDGNYDTFEFSEAPVMAPELAAKYPEIRTYLGYRVGNPSISVRFDFTPAGFHAQVLAPGNTYYIDPYYKGESYASYYRRDYRSTKKFKCFTESAHIEDAQIERPARFAARSGDVMREYRLAVACTGEYGVAVGATTKADALAAIVSTVNKVVGIFESELAIRLTLVGNNNLIVYINPAGDPFTSTDPTVLVGQSQAEIDAKIGNANYDIGHTFSTSDGGAAMSPSVCVASKATAVTGHPTTPSGNPFAVDYVAHEMAHQFNANHTFNGKTDGCTAGDWNNTTAYEPGSGSTIMGYASLCGADDLQANSDPYFHSASHDEIIEFITTGTGKLSATCGALPQPTFINAIPTVDAGSDYNIPKATPFVLTGSGADTNTGDALTYLWEQRDRDQQATLAAADDGKIPLFRVFTPVATGQRYFPRLATLVTNTPDNKEKLPQLDRTMNFRLTVRDGKGGVDSDDMQVTVMAASGPFKLTYPNVPETLTGLSTITVTWDASSTTAAPVSAANVDIYLSTDGGLNYDTASPLASSTLNDGTQEITVPNIDTTTARVMVKAAGNIFFDISDQNITINAVPVPEINLKQGTTNIPDGSSHDFGSKEVGTDADVPFIVENTGTANLTLAIPLAIDAGTHADQFSIQAQPGSPVAGSNTTTFTVRFKPTSAGVKTAKISIGNNDPDENPYILNLQGTGTVPGTGTPGTGTGTPGTGTGTPGTGTGTPPIASVMYVTSTTAAGSYSAGSVIAITVRFSLIVWVSGTPQLALAIGETPVMAYYSTGSGTEMLTFQYTVAAGDMISNLKYWSKWGLELNGGRIWDNMGNDVILTLPEPGSPGSLSGDIALSLDTDYPVYRFYRPDALKHFFTIDENEKEYLIANAADVWKTEGIAYYAFIPQQYRVASRLQRNTLQAVHRFYSEGLQTHLFTLDENEKETLIAEAADVWRYEGPAFYVPTGNQEGTVPVYRFYSEDLTVHLFTTDENEKNHLINNVSDIWRFEGIAYYAYP
ncbi:M12 family metallo-peptidase [Desulfococcaceae bacterium HSG9]|nr:M12 family metallo-peptidase [Desulfococcaceae bacterium HSG9]